MQKFEINVKKTSKIRDFLLNYGFSSAQTNKILKKTKIVMIANFIGYWLISIPVGYTLAFKYNMNIMGFWYGLVSAAIILCTIMFIILRKYINDMKKNLDFVRIGEEY